MVVLHVGPWFKLPNTRWSPHAGAEGFHHSRLRLMVLIARQRVSLLCNFVSAAASDQPAGVSDCPARNNRPTRTHGSQIRTYDKRPESRSAFPTEAARPIQVHQARRESACEETQKITTPGLGAVSMEGATLLPLNDCSCVARRSFYLRWRISAWKLESRFRMT